MQKVKIIICVIVLLLSCAAMPAWGKVYIDIDSPAFQKFPIAVPDFSVLGGSEGQGNLSRWFSDEMTRLLDITGYFRIIPRDAFLSDTGSGIAAGTIDFSSWAVVGADFLITGGYTVTEQELSVEFRLFDVVEGRLIAGKKYWGRPAEKKRILIRCIDEVLLKLTGERGVFDTKIAFAGKTGSVSELFLVNFDGTELTRITDYGRLTLLPQWSPDGKKISFTSYRDRNPDCYIMDLGTRRVTKASGSTGLNLSGPWSPDGKKMSLVLTREGNEDIYVLDIETNHFQRLTTDPSIDVSPTWSPDGRKIAFVSSRSGSPQVFVMDADGKNVRRLTYEGSYNTSPCWSPRGNRIAYEGTTNGVFQIFIIEEETGGVIQVTFENGGGEAPAWSPDGRYLVFTTRRGAKTNLCVINANGLNPRVIGSSPDLTSCEDPAWSPSLDLY
ncbi:MAG: Tol-Pal system beta propeller repeat protein TolB [Deltaproteobacteria bacterium]|nr:Tol-Pal system beta propeller repeat protein TolB [Deltaproteobacteria bacterium]